MFTLFTLNGKLIKAIAIFACCFLCVGWNGVAVQNQKPEADTVPPQQQKIQKDIDYHLQQLQKALGQLDEQLQQKNWEKVQKDIDAAIKSIDIDKMQQQFEQGLKQVDQGLKQIDMAKIQREVDAAMAKVNLEKMELEIKKAMQDAKNIDSKEIQKELKAAMEEMKKEMEEVKKIDFEEMKKDLEKTKQELKKEKIDIEKELQQTKEELRKMKIDMEKEFSQAKVDLQKAKDELIGYKNMISEMEKEGLIKKNEGYTIHYKNGELLINGNKQSKEVTDKYRKYIKKGTLTIKSIDGDIQID